MSEPHDERTRSDIDLRPGLPASSPAEPTRAFPIVIAPPSGADTYRGQAVPEPSPRAGPGDGRTVPFLAVLAAGEQATQLPAGGAAAPEPTVGFTGVLPVPGQRPAGGSVEPGQDLGGFRIGKRIAARSTCDLFVAAHPQHGECVVQVLGEGMAQSPAGRGFLLDARARMAVEDPRLVRLLGLGDGPRPWVALERLQGDTLRQSLDRQGGLGPDRAARLVLDLARGLSRLHARRIAHGDLTPRDVRLEPGGRAVITGFGTTKTIDGGTRRAYPGAPGLGAAIHAAPELLLGERVTPAADVWALGLLLVEATTGQPWVTGEPREVLATLTERALPPLPPALPEPLARIAQRCLERSPARRYPSAQDVAQALHPLVREERSTGGRGVVVAVVVVVGALLAGLATMAALLQAS